MNHQPSVQVRAPDGTILLPQDPALRQAILKPRADFWQKGNAELTIDFHVEAKSSHLLVLWERVHGYHLLHWTQTLDDPLVALSGDSYLDLVDFEICGELIPTPAAMFVTPKAACAAIAEFLKLGEPDPALVWVRKREQHWGTAATQSPVGVPPDRIQELKSLRPPKKAPSPLAAMFQHLRNHDHQAVKADIQSGAVDINKKFQSERPITLACQQGDPEMVALLLDHGADPNGLNADDDAGLHLSTSAEITQMLLDAGARVDLRGGGECTALHRAATRSGPIVQLLVSHGADLEARDANGFTPLLRAADGGKPEIVELLLKLGAVVDARSNRGATALSMLFSHSMRPGVAEELLSILLKHGADPLARDKNGTDAFMLYCIRPGRLDTAQMFIDAGADPCYADSSGRSAIQMAELFKNHEMLEFLRHHVEAKNTRNLE